MKHILKILPGALACALLLSGCGRPAPEGGEPVPTQPGTKLLPSAGRVATNTMLYLHDGKPFGTVVQIEPMHHFEDGRTGLGWLVKSDEKSAPRWHNGDQVEMGTMVKVPAN